MVSVREPFWLGERSQRYRFETESLAAPGDWRVLARGSVIGSRNILLFDRIAIAELAPRIEKYAVEYRTNKDMPWKVALEGGDAGTHYEHCFATVQARYVRLHIRDASDAPTLWEFQVFAP